MLANALERAKVGDQFKRDAQIEKSKSLTGDARRELLGGNIKSAIEFALNALPDKSQKDDKPFYPEAEVVLYEALQTIPRPQAILATKDPSRSVVSVTFSRDGTRAVGVAKGSKIPVWDAESGALLFSVDGDHAALSPDGKQLSVSLKEAVKLYSLATGTEIVVGAVDGEPTFLTFSPDGTRLGVAYANDYADILDAATLRSVTRLQQPATNRIHQLVFSPDGANILTICNNLYTARLFDAHNGRELKLLLGHRSTSPHGLLQSGSFAPSGNRFVTGGRDTALLWNARGVRIGEFAVSGVTKVAFSPVNGDRLLTAHDGAYVRMWDVPNARSLGDLSFPFGGISAVQYSADGGRVLGAGGGLVQVCDTDLKVLNRIWIGQETLVSAALSPDGKRVITGTEEGSVLTWLADPQLELAVLPLSHDATKVAFAPDGRSLAVTGYEGTVQNISLPGNVAPDSGVSISPQSDTYRYAEPENNGTATVVESGQQRARVANLAAHGCTVREPVLSPDGTRVAAICADAIHVWKVFPSTQAIVDEAKQILDGLLKGGR